MSKQQYLRLIEIELHRVNKIIDMKIIQGKDYRREALEHKQLLHKIRQHNRNNAIGKFLNSLNRFPIFANL